MGVLDQVICENRDGIALITLSRGSANALVPSLRQELDAALTEAIDAENCQGIVLTGGGRGFSAGFDLSEFDRPTSPPALRDICRRIEDSPKPVICALHGMALGAGLELALAAHARVAQPATRLAFPDIRLGMIPGAGGTQRLPRLLGAQKSLEMMLSGKSFQAESPEMKRIITQLSDASFVDDAIAMCRTLANRMRWSRTRDFEVGFSDPEGYQAAISAARAQLQSQHDAAADIVRCVEAAQLLPFAQGVAYEEAAFAERLDAPTARAARHVLMAERMASVVPGSAAKATRDVSRVTIIGCDGLAAEVTIAGLRAGLQIDVLAADAAGADRLRAVTSALGDAALRLSIVLSQSELTPAPIVLDDGTGAGLDEERLAPSTVWVGLKPNMSHLRAGNLSQNGRFVPTSISRPIHAVQFAEISTLPGVASDAIASVVALFGRMGIKTIQVAVPAGSVGLRLNCAFHAAACGLIAHGAEYAEIDEAAHSLGFSFGPFEMMDRIGTERSIAQLESYAALRGRELPGLDILNQLSADGYAGRSSGHGFYRYSDETATLDEELAERLMDMSEDESAAGLTIKQLSLALHGAIANEAAALISENVVLRASDVDFLMVRTMGVKPEVGGLLLQADLFGVFRLYQCIQSMKNLSPVWQPHVQLEKMVKDGNGFFGRSFA